MSHENGLKQQIFPWARDVTWASDASIINWDVSLYYNSTFHCQHWGYEVLNQDREH